jgi:hypothetical protein
MREHHRAHARGIGIVVHDDVAILGARFMHAADSTMTFAASAAHSATCLQPALIGALQALWLSS